MTYPQQPERPALGQQPRPAQQYPAGYPQPMPYGYQQPMPPPVYYQPPIAMPHPAYAVTKVRKDTSHTFHLLMTLFTCGMWAIFVWLPIIIWNSMGPRRKIKTRYR